jgi:hypothetical protein
MWPRSQWLQISTWTRQTWHKNSRAGVPSASSWQSPPACAAPRSCRRRNPSRVRSCPCIRAPARCRARRRCELPCWDRCRACLRISTVLIATADRLSGAARLRTGKNSLLQIWNWKKAAPLRRGDRAAGRVNQDENAGHDPAIRAAIVVARGLLTSRGLPRWVHRSLPSLRFAAREMRSATGRGPPTDYLDNLLPASIVGAYPNAAKKVRISTGVHSGNGQ